MKKLFIALFVILLALPLVSAVDPHSSTTVTTNGLIITSIFPDSIKQNNNYTFYWYVQNQSNSAFMNNNSISCAFEIYKQSGLNGLHLFDIKGTFDGVEEWSAYADGGNFSLLGDYVERVKCNSTINTGIGGVSDNQLIVTKSGRDYTLHDFLPLIIAFLSVIIILLVLAFILSNDHGILAVGFAGIGFYMLVPLLNIANLALENNILDAGISGMVGTITQILTWADYALIIYIIVYIFIKVISGYNQDQKEKIEGLR